MIRPLARVQGLRVVTADERAILRGVDLDVADDAVTAVVGESGAGKTTLALSLLGTTRPGLRISAGTIDVAGTDLRHAGQRGLRQLRRGTVAYLPQEPAATLCPTMRLSSQLRDRCTGPVGPAELLDHLRVAGLPADPALLRRYPHQLSGGQQQRAALALALAQRPRLLVLDEPTQSLDVITRAAVLGQIRRVREATGCAILIVTHDLTVVAELADQLTVLRHGALVEAGPARAVLHRPERSYTAELIAACPEPLVTDDPGALRCRTSEVPRAGVLQVEGLVARHHIRAGPITAAADLSLRLAAGECLALVGASGAGKTTIARSIIGLHHPDAGRITVSGRLLPPAVTDRTPRQRAAVQLVPQDPFSALNPYRSIGDAIARPLRRLGGLDRPAAVAETIRLLRLVQLAPELAARRPRQLSGGERQRAVLARALAARPLVLLCDEPTAALDVSVQAAVLDTIDELRQTLGLGILLISHDLGVVARAAQRVAVLDGGRIVEQGEVDRVLRSPQHPVTLALLAAAPSLRRTLGVVVGE